ncbi:hypothetical protein CJF31_00004315 [Rutstroemia sp. NJR-2017a BVV2]|nr:hypothetical protein CJF31_00004315 [Rutstroemia sp. NJR-2017a BVV2]
MLTQIFFTAVLLRTAIAQRPANISVCDYYTTALLKDNTAENQATLLTLLVNTAVIGNCKTYSSRIPTVLFAQITRIKTNEHIPDTQPNTGIAVPGILAPGTYDGTQVSLAKYFNGNLASTNRGGSEGVKVNFLDGGGAVPLTKNLAADDKGSNQ